MAAQSSESASKKRKLDALSASSASNHTRVSFTGPGHDVARAAAAEGEEVLNSQNHKYETFTFEGSTYVLTGPNQQVLVAYDPEHPAEFWNEVTEKNFITAHLQHHPMKMEVFVQDMKKTYVLPTKNEAKNVLKKVLGNKRIPYAAASKVGNREVRGPWVYAMVPPVLFNDYVAKQKQNARKLIGGSVSKAEGKEGDTEAATAAEDAAPAVVQHPPQRKRAASGAPASVRRGAAGASRSSRATAAPMQTSGDETKATAASTPRSKVSPVAQRYKPLALSPVRPSSAAVQLSESQSQSIDHINGMHKSLTQLCGKLADTLITQRATDEYLADAVATYNKMWNGCTTYVQLKQNMLARKNDIEAKNEQYSLMDDMVWMFILTNPDLVRKLRNRVAETRTVVLESGIQPRPEQQASSAVPMAQ